MKDKWHIIQARGYVSVKSTNDDETYKTSVYGTMGDMVLLTVTCLRALHDKGGWDTQPVIQALRDEVARKELRDEVARQASADSSARAEK